MNEFTNEQFFADTFKSVAAWNKNANAPFNPKNEFKMTGEEHLELTIAKSMNDTEETVDAYLDIIFVLLGSMYKRRIDISVLDFEDIKKNDQANLSFYNAIKNDGLFTRFHFEQMAQYLVNIIAKMNKILEKKGITLAMAEVVRANDDKLIPCGDGVHAEIEGFKIGKPKDWTPPNYEQIFKEYLITK